MIQQLLTAFFISGFIVSLALWRGSLARSGAVSAMIVGILTFGFGGWRWGMLLGIFFISSSLLSHFKEDEKRIVAEKFDKGHQRDSGQVIANGGLGSLVAILNFVTPSPIWAALFVGIMATVTADTWATELGTLSKQPPRLVTNGRVVEVGTSGGITLLGTMVSASGGLLIGLVATLLGLLSAPVAIGAISGLIGSLFDSLLGATVQQVYYCDKCRKETERKHHKCGYETRPLRGWSWLNNDLVNFFASFVGGGTAILLMWLTTNN